MSNEKLADSISEGMSGDFHEGALKMAEIKDRALKEFFLLHIDIPYTGGRGKDGSPLALDYIKWLEERDKKATEIFEKYKEYEDKHFT